MTSEVMVSVETINLTGTALDFAVAHALGHNPKVRGIIGVRQFIETDYTTLFAPSSDPEQGWPLIHEHHIALSPPEAQVHPNGGTKSGWGESGMWTCTSWKLRKADGHRGWSYHETDPLIAAMRLIVDVKLGDSVEMPAVLIG